MSFVGKAYKGLVRASFNKSNNHKFRYVLEMSFSQNPTNPIIVIMKNPSKTCDNASKNPITTYKDKQMCHTDRTTGIIVQKLRSLNYDKIIVLNLFAVYSTDPSKVVSSYDDVNDCEQLLHENYYIGKTLLDNKRIDVICAWGEPKGIKAKKYNYRILTIVRMLHGRPLREWDSTINNLSPLKSIYPLHGLKWK